MSAWSTALLDFCDVASDGTRFDATLDLARRAESLGFGAFWLAEHYARNVGHANAPMATVAVAGVTERMRVGPAGMLMRYTQPVVAANAWSLLAELFPERIDFGLSMGAAAPPYDALVSYGLEPGLIEPLARMEATARLLFRDAEIALVPPRREDPRLWFLGGSARAATSAAKHGARFCLSLTHSASAPPPECAAAYLEHFAPRAGCEPELAILVGGVCLPDVARRDAALARSLGSWAGQRLLSGDRHFWVDALAELGATYRTRNVVFRDVCANVDDRMESIASFLNAVG
jgi:alkanesulfonate monooxygenase SsuD/methylene tetrahydromethanopterin reductase-like flavin-dependent oxidoreductase (luciferase family)